MLLLLLIFGISELKAVPLQKLRYCTYCHFCVVSMLLYEELPAKWNDSLYRIICHPLHYFELLQLL